MIFRKQLYLPETVLNASNLQLYRIKYSDWIQTIWPIDGILTNSITTSQGGLGSNDSEGILHTLHLQNRSLCSPKAWVRSQIKSYKRLKKWYLMPPCLTLSIIRCGSRVKWSNPGKGVAPSLTPWCSCYRNGSLLVTLDYGCQLLL